MPIIPNGFELLGVIRSRFRTPRSHLIWDLMLERFVSGMPNSFKVAKRGVRFQAVLVKADVKTGRATAIERIDIPADS